MQWLKGTEIRVFRLLYHLKNGVEGGGGFGVAVIPVSPVHHQNRLKTIQEANRP